MNDSAQLTQPNAAMSPSGPRGPVLLLGGDTMTGRGIDQVLGCPCDPRLYESCVQDAREYVLLAERASGRIRAPVAVDYVWGEALAAMERIAPDLRIVNLETAVTQAGVPWPGKGIHYRMHPANVGCLLAARIDACALANNHVLDWSREGLEETLGTLAAAGLKCAGAGRDDAQAWSPAVMPCPQGGRVLLFSVATDTSGVPREWAAGPRRPGVALLADLSPASCDALAQAVHRHREPGDLVAVSVHWGGNWGLAVPAQHQRFARRLIDLGAAHVVHGHSSHHPLPVEVWRGQPILYGCGDLLNDYEGIGMHHGRLRCDVTCLYALRLDGAGRLQRMDIVPLQLRRFRLEAADAPARRWLREVFDDGAHAFGTGVRESAEGDFTLHWR